jgi:hypothetical protein
VQCGAGIGTQADDIAGVWRNLWAEQDDLEHLTIIGTEVSFVFGYFVFA